MTLSPASIFSDNMVLQQGVPVPIWGTADAGAGVVVTFAGQSISTVADAAGRWKAELLPLAASFKSRELIVTASFGSTISCKNVLVGEVWICSGQSNMEWQVVMSNNPEAEIAAADHPAVRLFTVARRLSLEPVEDIPGNGWAVCSPLTIEQFSAVGYFFGRELRKQLDVPIGLINSTWGGTPAESWTSKQGLLNEPTVAHLVTDTDPSSPQAKELTERWRGELKAIESMVADKQNKGFAEGFAELSHPDKQWPLMHVPSRWQSHGLNFNGILWFRKSVELPARWAGMDLELGIGATDKSDVTYFNGQQVGSITMKQRPDSWCFPRTYPVPAALAQGGKNVIAVRVHSDRYDGGMIGPAMKMHLTCPAHPEDAPISLVGDWRYAVEANYGNVVYPPTPPGPENPWTPSILFNAMIAPAVPYALRGAIWYQGESNEDRAVQYRTLFPALIKDWRAQWHNENLAFYFVQLANFRAVLPQPVESKWADLRQAQAMALALPHTGMAVAIDIGEADDIHPRNKQDVGLRLAYSALHGTYGKTEIPSSGPVARKAVSEGTSVRIEFDHVEEGLVCRGDGLKGFAVAGEHRTFHWCEGMIDHGTVVLIAPLGTRYVRYAWADNPVCNLYNSAGLPAVPFEIEVL